MATNEENAREIVFQCLAEAGIKSGVAELSEHIVSSLSEFELISEATVTENTLVEAVASYHGLSQDEAESIIHAYNQSLLRCDSSKYCTIHLPSSLR